MGGQGIAVRSTKRLCVIILCGVVVSGSIIGLGLWYVLSPQHRPAPCRTAACQAQPGDTLLFNAEGLSGVPTACAHSGVINRQTKVYCVDNPTEALRRATAGRDVASTARRQSVEVTGRFRTYQQQLTNQSLPPAHQSQSRTTYQMVHIEQITSVRLVPTPDPRP